MHICTPLLSPSPSFPCRKLIESLIDNEAKNGIPTDKVVLAGFSQGIYIYIYIYILYIYIYNIYIYIYIYTSSPSPIITGAALTLYTGLQHKSKLAGEYTHIYIHIICI